jgi:hypothetical protein
LPLPLTAAEVATDWLRSALLLRVPRKHFAGYDAVSRQGIAILEGLDLRGSAFCRVQRSLNRQQTEAQLSALAELHAQFGEVVPQQVALAAAAVEHVGRCGQVRAHVQVAGGARHLWVEEAGTAVGAKLGRVPVGGVICSTCRGAAGRVRHCPRYISVRFLLNYVSTVHHSETSVESHGARS